MGFCTSRDKSNEENFTEFEKENLKKKFKLISASHPS